MSTIVEGFFEKTNSGGEVYNASFCCRLFVLNIFFKKLFCHSMNHFAYIRLRFAFFCMISKPANASSKNLEHRYKTPVKPYEHPNKTLHFLHFLLLNSKRGMGASSETPRSPCSIYGRCSGCGWVVCRILGFWGLVWVLGFWFGGFGLGWGFGVGLGFGFWGFGLGVLVWVGGLGLGWVWVWVGLGWLGVWGFGFLVASGRAPKREPGALAAELSQPPAQRRAGERRAEFLETQGEKSHVGIKAQ